MLAAWIAATASVLVLLYLWSLLPYRRRRRSGPWYPQGQLEKEKGHSLKKPSGTVHTLVVLGSGGHTSEMLKMISRLSPGIYTPLCYVVASTDHTSAKRIPADDLTPGRCQICKIPRSREVGQSYITSVWTTLVACLYSAAVVAKVRPDLVLVNGPGTCIPVCAAAFALRVFRVRPNSRIVFCESFCRVKSLSLSGRIMYFFADRFVVHWPELLKRYPRAEYLGQLM